MPKIMIVDDELAILEFAGRFLRRRNYDVVTASGTDEAIAKIKQDMPDLIFSDVRIEKDDSGLDILKAAKQIKPNIVVYLVTGRVDTQIEEEGLKNGAKEVLRKPIDVQTLENKIKKALNLK